MFALPMIVNDFPVWVAAAGELAAPEDTGYVSVLPPMLLNKTDFTPSGFSVRTTVAVLGGVPISIVVTLPPEMLHRTGPLMP